MEVDQEFELLIDYIKGWWIKLWDHAYIRVFKGVDAFKKLDLFKDFKGSNFVVKKILYWYGDFNLSLYSLCFCSS